MAQLLATTILSLNATIGCLCAALLGLTAHGAYLKSHVDDALPASVNTVSLSLLFYPGVGGVVDFGVFLTFWIVARRAKSHLRLWNGLLPFVATFIFLRPFIVLIYTFTVWDKARKVQNSANATVEVWACRTASSGRASIEHDLCRQLSAARWLQVPVLVLAFAMLALVWWRHVTKGKSPRT